MKKIFALILGILYMGASTGATFHMHYCMDKLTEVQLWHEDSKKCDQCTAGHSDSCRKKCCKDQHKTVKLEKDQHATENLISFMQQATAVIPVSWATFSPGYVVSLVEAFPVSHAPPRSSKVAPHILHCSFLI
ncbi:HYC_CC_PP family protein [Chitinophaga arvensicola]|uniref:Uncharacterized protein n=1 Tax=Chitinophaga arvensicola TaxID=29529 RepID=A0A1I0S7K8_9BACT|nr:hypothetical protein [Chitinophaga arvensicola]SEW51748.1 hypothetical protein SAMN04488122_4482 [Chitinophaga arvensicola]